MTRWLTALAIAAVASGCYCSHEREPDAGEPDDAVSDAPPEHVEGCDDPRIWEVDAPASSPVVEIGGGPCEPAQYPVHAAFVSARPRDLSEWARLVRSCWRVTAAHPESGWEVGAILASPSPSLMVHVVGHERPVTFEGRAIRDDGVVGLATRGAVVALEPPRIVSADLTELVALGSTEETSLARARSVHVGGADHATEGIVIAATVAAASSDLMWLERVGTELFFRVHQRGATPAMRSVSLGSPVEATLATGGAVVLLDRHELVLIGEAEPTVAHRVVLSSEVGSIAVASGAVVVHAGGELIAFDRAGVERSRLAVGPGTLLPSPTRWGDPALFWDGARAVPVDLREALALDDARAMTPTPDERAIAGELLAVGHDVLIGREGIVHFTRHGGAVAGARAVAARALYGGPITHVAADTTSYVVTRDDGTATLYRVPFVDFCE